MCRPSLFSTLICSLAAVTMSLPAATGQAPSRSTDALDMGRAKPLRAPRLTASIDPTIDWPPAITLTADNNQFLSLVARKSQQNCEASKPKADERSELQVTVVGNPRDHTIALKGHNNKYLGRVRRGKVDYIEFAKPKIDQYCVFRYFRIADNKVALKADNGKFLGRVIRDKHHNIEAAKGTIDAYCQFTVGERLLGKEITDIVYHLDRASVADESPLVTMVSEINNSSSNATVSKTLTWTYTRSTVGTWNNESGVTVGAEVSFEAGTPVYKGGAKLSVENSRKWSWGGSKETTEEVSDSTGVTVPPMTRLEVQVVIKRAQIEVPFTYTVNRRLPNGEVKVQSGLKGVYRNIECYQSEVATMDAQSHVKAN